MPILWCSHRSALWTSTLVWITLASDLISVCSVYLDLDLDLDVDLVNPCLPEKVGLSSSESHGRPQVFHFPTPHLHTRVLAADFTAQPNHPTLHTETLQMYATPSYQINQGYNFHAHVFYGAGIVSDLSQSSMGCFIPRSWLREIVNGIPLSTNSFHTSMPRSPSDLNRGLSYLHFVPGINILSLSRCQRFYSTRNGHNESSGKNTTPAAHAALPISSGLAMQVEEGRKLLHSLFMQGPLCDEEKASSSQGVEAQRCVIRRI